MIYIVRHGQTAWNLQARKQGQKDSPLTIKGINQAQNIASMLKDNIPNIKDFEIVISPQWRCQQSSSIMCEILGIDFSKCKLENGIREHCFGSWEGKTEEEIEIEYPGFLEKRYIPENYWSYIVPMGESYELLNKRVSLAIEKHQGKNVIFICHVMVSKVMRGILLGLTNEETLALNHPQDTVYKIQRGKLEKLVLGKQS